MISGAPKLRITLHGIAVTRNSGSRRRRRCGYVIFATMKRAACRFGPNETNSMKGASERHKNLFTLPGRGRRAGRKEGRKEGRMTTFPSSSSSPSSPSYCHLTFILISSKDCGAVSCRVSRRERARMRTVQMNECLRVNTPLC